MNNPHPFTTVALPDGIVVGGPWPYTTVAWPGGKGRSATKPEYDLFQALETAVMAEAALRAERDALVKERDHLLLKYRTAFSGLLRSYQKCDWRIAQDTAQKCVDLGDRSDNTTP